jgi:hypothetical protein
VESWWSAGAAASWEGQMIQASFRLSVVAAEVMLIATAVEWAEQMVKVSFPLLVVAAAMMAMATAVEMSVAALIAPPFSSAWLSPIVDDISDHAVAGIGKQLSPPNPASLPVPMLWSNNSDNRELVCDRPHPSGK